MWFKGTVGRADMVNKMSIDSPQQAPISRPRRWPSDLHGWAKLVESGAMPILGSSAEALEECRSNEDAVDAHTLSDIFASDPLMVLKVLAYVANLRRGHDGSDPETLTAALVMLGIGPFFRGFGEQQTVESVLSVDPAALAGFRRVLLRSHRAARFALAFAVHRMDHDAAVLHEAALLHDFAELLMWIRAPRLCAEVSRLQAMEPTLRTADAQAKVFGIKLPDLQHLLMLRWRLPSLLIDVSDDNRESVSSQARTVVLAIRVARHTAVDWENPAIGDDVREIAALLHMGEQPTLELLRDIDLP